MYTIDISQKALDGLFEIEYYLRLNESETRADKIMASIEHQIDLIAENPLKYPRYKETEYYRKAVVHQTYIVIFKAIDTQITIIDIYHGKRNI